MEMRKAGANWVEGDKFFDRKVDLELLAERVSEGTHTLLTAQRRMGKTSLVRELLRRLRAKGCFETIFVDLEDAGTPADAIAEIGAQSRSVRSVWHRIMPGFADVLRGVGDRVDSLEISELCVKLRADIDDGNWREKGDEIIAALAKNEQPLVLAIDEFPIFINRMLKGPDYRITPEGRQMADGFLSWLRKSLQLNRGRICVILAGSVSLEPILRQANLSAQANIFSAFDLKPWDEETATAFLATLATTYGIDLPLVVRRSMCRWLRCQVPHHVQCFFEHMYVHLYRAGRREASLEDVELVYISGMLSVRGQVDMDHYVNRLQLVLGTEGYHNALDMLTEAAVNEGVLRYETIEQYRDYFRTGREMEAVSAEEILRLLEHDGYLVPQNGGYRFESGLLEDWWRARHGRYFVPVGQRLGSDGK